MNVSEVFSKSLIGKKIKVSKNKYGVWGCRQSAEYIIVEILEANIELLSDFSISISVECIIENILQEVSLNIEDILED